MSRQRTDPHGVRLNQMPEGPSAPWMALQGTLKFGAWTLKVVKLQGMVQIKTPNYIGSRRALGHRLCVFHGCYCWMQVQPSGQIQQAT